MGLFGGGDSRKSDPRTARIPRVSSGWAHLLKSSLHDSEGQRILDIGPTSSTNINFLTNMGHSIYMANLAAEAADAKWKPAEKDAPFPTDAFLDENLDIGDRKFDTILFWDTADYLDAETRKATIGRLHSVLEPGGHLLAFFHIKPETGLYRYHLREDGQVEAQMTSDLAVRDVLNNRQIENLFADFSSYKFFLAKDNLREVIVIR